MKKVIFTIFLLCLSLIITILLSEVLLRVFWVKPTGVDVSGITTKDKMLGFRFVPNSSTVLTGLMNDYQTSVKINSHGFRGKEHEIENKLNKKRIILIGDSVVFGLGTEEEENIDMAMERLLNENSSSSYEVINLGMPGIGTLVEEKVLKLYGLKYKPDIVIVFVNAVNDLNDNVNYNRAHSIHYSSSTNNTRRYKADKFQFRDIKESYLYNFCKWQFRPFLLKSKVIRKVLLYFHTPTNKDLPSSIKDWYTRKSVGGISLMKASLERISLLSKQHKFRLSVVITPSRPQFDKNYEHLLAAIMPSYLRDEYKQDSLKPQRVVREICNDMSIHYIEVLDDLIYLRNMGISLTYPNDGHPNAQYNSEIAKTVVRELRSNGSL